MDGFLFRKALDHKTSVTGAWLTAAWSRSKRKMPALNQVLRRLESEVRHRAEIKAKESLREDYEDLAKEMAPELEIISS